MRALDHVGGFIVSVIVCGLGSPAGAQGQAKQGPDNASLESNAASAHNSSSSRLSELCQALPEIPGKALGIEKRCPRGGSSSGVARADFNKDGFGDLAIGVPFEDVGTVVDAGAVYVIYGSANGLTAPLSGTAVPQAQSWTQGSVAVPDTSETDDRFGAALAAGDFNNDGTTDLAIGAPGENAGAGAVTIIYGTPHGLDTNAALYPSPSRISAASLANCGTEMITLEGSCIAGQPLLAVAIFTEMTGRGSYNMGLGSSLAWGDFDGDGAKDLAIGAPDASFINITEPKGAGAIIVVYGSSGTPLTSQARRAVIMQEDRRSGPTGITTSESYDHFGLTLAAGNFNGGKYTDLAVGVPYEDIGSIAGAGQVHVFFGCTAKLDQCGRTIISQNTTGIGGVPEASDLFGLALTVGNFNADSNEDLVVGVPYENVGSSVNAGIVHVFYGSPDGFDFSVSQLWDQNNIFGSAPSSFEGSPSEANDYFGYSVAAADFNGDGRDDLAIGVPYEDVVTDRTGTLTTVVNGGEVDVLYGSPLGLSTARTPQMWHQDSINIEDTVETADLFGFSLSAWNFGGAGSVADLAIGVPLEDVGATECGAVSVLYGSPAANGLASASDQFWSQSSTNFPGSCETGDKFGRALY